MRCPMPEISRLDGALRQAVERICRDKTAAANATYVGHPVYGGRPMIPCVQSGHYCRDCEREARRIA